MTPEKSNTSKNNSSGGFSAEEKAAMKERAKELKAEARANKNKADGESDLLAKINEMAEPDRLIAIKLHQLMKANAPMLWPKTWYGMPAYAKDGKVVCFFQSGQKFDTRYCTLGFNDAAKLDDRSMWPTSFAITEMNADVEVRILDLVKKAVG